MEKSKQRTRDNLFWPGMGKEIEAIVEKCATCLAISKMEPKRALMSHKIPERPLQVLATNLFSWNGEDYVVLADYYSRYFELEKLYSTTISCDPKAESHVLTEWHSGKGNF